SSFSRAFYSIGSHTVTLEVTDSNGFRITLTVSFNVIPQPSVSFTTQYDTIDAGLQDIFTSSVSGGTSPYTYAWTVNGNIVGDSSSLAYTFNAAGSYAVNLTVNDSFCFTSTYSKTIQVVNDPEISIVANRTIIDSGLSIAFLSGISGGTSPYNYTWEINGIVVGYGSVLDHTFTSSGTYTTHLSVVDSFGLSSSYVV
ncbi:PKD domain-containing protein, partial [Metallibacterium scheffleri]|uniref:PKD domain-containing protein n=1 Tax=Metallibacterium scheffleri TaxID=993689 RepID=UPI0023F1650A